MQKEYIIDYSEGWKAKYSPEDKVSVNFIAFDELMESIAEIYRDTRADFRAVSICDDDTINEMAFYAASDIEADMRKYLHQRDTSIWGNFNNISWNYPREHDGASFRDVVAKIEEGTLPAAEYEKWSEWLLNWFYETFGTYGLSYNFGDFLTDEICEWESENEMEWNPEPA